jgi:hypothetical protein
MVCRAASSLSYALLRAQRYGGPKGSVWTSGRVGEHFPAKHFSFPEHQVFSMGECTVPLKSDVSFHEALVMKYTSQFLEHLKVKNFVDSSISGQEIKQHPLASQSTVLIVFPS